MPQRQHFKVTWTERCDHQSCDRNHPAHRWCTTEAEAKRWAEDALFPGTYDIVADFPQLGWQQVRANVWATEQDGIAYAIERVLVGRDKTLNHNVFGYRLFAGGEPVMNWNDEGVRWFTDLSQAMAAADVLAFDVAEDV